MATFQVFTFDQNTYVMAIIYMLTTPLAGLLLIQIPARDANTHSYADLTMWQYQHFSFLTKQNLTQYLKLI